MDNNNSSIYIYNYTSYTPTLIHLSFFPTSLPLKVVPPTNRGLVHPISKWTNHPTNIPLTTPPTSHLSHNQGHPQPACDSWVVSHIPQPHPPSRRHLLGSLHQLVGRVPQRRQALRGLGHVLGTQRRQVAGAQALREAWGTVGESVGKRGNQGKIGMKPGKTLGNRDENHGKISICFRKA